MGAGAGRRVTGSTGSRRPGGTGRRHRRRRHGPRSGPGVDGSERPRRQPAFGATVLTVLLPVLLMLVKAVCDLTLGKSNGAAQPPSTCSATRRSRC